MKKPTHIACRRWFSTNTYFSVYISFDDGTLEKVISFENGYGEHCLHEALRWLEQNGYINTSESVSATLRLREELNCSYDIIDVQRKKDM